MNIHYIENVRMPTEKAHGYQIAKMCEALAAEGVQVSLVVPTRKNEIPGDIFSYYGIHGNFSVRYVPTFDALSFFRGSRFGFYVQVASFLLVLYHERIVRDTTIITRSPEIAWWYSRKGYRVFYDAHNFPIRGGWLLAWLLKNVTGIIANSNGTAEAFRHIGHTRVLVVPNAVDLGAFNKVTRVSRTELGLPEGYIAMYVGHLYEWKGVGVVVDAARRSKRDDLMFVFVGGTDADMVRFRAETNDTPNLIFLGRRPHHEVPALIKSADVLLLPNIPSTRESELYTSPIKMFEYMASGVPVVASDLPSIREILNDKNAILVAASDPNMLLDGVERVVRGEAVAQAACAQEDVKKYTWSTRARAILGFVKA